MPKLSRLTVRERPAALLLHGEANKVTSTSSNTTGTKRELDRHLKKGNSRNSRHCFRLYFFWDDEDEQVVVGWLTSHLDTRQTLGRVVARLVRQGSRLQITGRPGSLGPGHCLRMMMRSRPFYTSKYLIQDTAKSIGVHMATGFSGKPHAAYIEFWGVMQALVIRRMRLSSYTSRSAKWRQFWRKRRHGSISGICNRCAGHPASNTHSSKGTTLRSFMGRGFGGYDQMMYGHYDAATGKTTPPKVNLRKLVGDLGIRGARILSQSWSI